MQIVWRSFFFFLSCLCNTPHSLKILIRFIFRYIMATLSSIMEMIMVLFSLASYAGTIVMIFLFWDVLLSGTSYSIFAALVLCILLLVDGFLTIALFGMFGQGSSPPNAPPTMPM